MIDDYRYLQAVLRQDLSCYIQKVFHTVDYGTPYLHNWHIDLISEYLVACKNREIKRLIINIPPRYMKSIACTVAFPSWLLGHNPSEKIMCSSYAMGLSTKHSVDTRLIMQQEWYQDLFPHTKLTDDQNTKTKFSTTASGHRIATSVGGTATGEGGNFLICDDPLNPKLAASETERQNAIDWFDQTWSSRLNDKKNGVMIVVMQRLHENDISGHLIDKNADWEVCSIKGIATDSYFINFKSFQKEIKAGEPLHEERENLKDLEIRKMDLGSYGFSSQYQQSPTPEDGGIVNIKWFKRYEQEPLKFDRIIQSWDTASKAKEHNDPSCCTTWGVLGNDYYLLDVLVDRLEYPALKGRVISMANRYKPDTILIEDKASGQALLQELRRELTMALIGILPKEEKLIRMSSCSSLIEAGRVYLPKNSSWLASFENELSLFPNSTHDDQVDSTSQFLNWLKKPKLEPSIRGF